jgi:hypothetical protein
MSFSAGDAPSAAVVDEIAGKIDAIVSAPPQQT